MNDALLVALVSAGASVLTAVITGSYLVASKKIEKSGGKQRGDWKFRMLISALILAIVSAPITWAAAFVGDNLFAGGNTNIFLKDGPFYQIVADRLSTHISDWNYVGGYYVNINGESVPLRDSDWYKEAAGRFTEFQGVFTVLGDYQVYNAIMDAADAALVGSIAAGLTFALGLFIGSRNPLYYTEIKDRDPAQPKE